MEKKRVFEQPSKGNAHVYFFKKYKWNDFSLFFLLLLQPLLPRSVISSVFDAFCDFEMWNFSYWIVCLVCDACIIRCHFHFFRCTNAKIPRIRQQMCVKWVHEIFESVKWTQFARYVRTHFPAPFVCSDSLKCISFTTIDVLLHKSQIIIIIIIDATHYIRVMTKTHLEI